MDQPDRPQIYLVTPPDVDVDRFAQTLARVLDATSVACLRLSLATRDSDALMRAADALREVAHARDIAIAVEDHVGMVARLGLDGVHLRDGARQVRRVRADLGADAIVGTSCGASRHEGMTAAEAGADYVSFGPARDDGLGDGTVAEIETFRWWSEIVEVPVVAEGALDVTTIRALAPHVDFFALRGEVWDAEDPAASLLSLSAAMMG